MWLKLLGFLFAIGNAVFWLMYVRQLPLPDKHFPNCPTYDPPTELQMFANFYIPLHVLLHFVLLLQIIVDFEDATTVPEEETIELVPRETESPSIVVSRE